MIYLIESAGFSKDGFTKLLKIGYTKDDGLDLRISQYKLHNPTCRLLFTIPGADEIVEKSLHEYFKDYRFDEYGKEWYEYNDSIVKYFNTHTTVESLKPIIKFTRNKKVNPILKKRIEEAINEALHYLYSIDFSLVSIDDFKKYKDLLLHDKIIITKEDVWNYFKDKVDSRVTKNNIENYISRREDIENDLSTIKSLNSFGDRMKFLCELSDNNRRSKILNQVNIKYKILYNTLGPSRIKSLGYNITRIYSELDNIKVDKSEIAKEIYLKFTVGERYTNTFIKTELQDIYSKAGYSKVAKSIDLIDYFEIKNIQIIDKITKKKIHGLEIISKL